MTAALVHTEAIAARHIRTFARQPWWIAISLMQPVIYLVLFSQLFSAMGALPAFGGSYLSFLLPGIVVMSALSSGGWAGTASIDDIHRGVMDRMLVTPVRRAAVIIGHLGQQAFIVDHPGGRAARPRHPRRRAFRWRRSPGVAAMLRRLDPARARRSERCHMRSRCELARRKP